MMSQQKKALSVTESFFVLVLYTTAFYYSARFEKIFFVNKDSLNRFYKL